MRSNSGARSSSRVSAAGARERLTVPTSLSGLVSGRLAALSEDVREVLEPVALLSEPDGLDRRGGGIRRHDSARAASNGGGCGDRGAR